MNTLYWHDYETFGIDPRYDRPAQFAGIRTDEDLNIIGKPLVIYCQLAADSLPNPQACLVTGISPQHANEKGLNEAEFIKQIHQQLAQPNTCSVGYNSLRFDDEFTRFILYRNFYDPYAREWQNGNSRWDIIDMVRLTRALRPAGINWPDGAEGKPSFKLESLTAANQIDHQGAHDALADVYATIALAKLIKKVQPKLYDYLYQHRHKNALAPLLNLRDPKPVIHVSRMYSSEYCGAALVVPVAKDPNNTNGIIVYDLRYDPTPLLNEDPATLSQWMFSKTEDLPAGAIRPALKTVHINKCPVIVPENTLDEAAAQRLHIDRGQHQQHWQQLNTAGDLTEKIAAIFAKQHYDPIIDPDASLYSGGFFSNNDKRKMELVRSAKPEHLQTLSIPFDDPRLSELLFRYRARNWPHSLTNEEQQDWLHYRQQRLMGDDPHILSLADFSEQIKQCKTQDLTEQQQQLLTTLSLYGQELATELAPSK